MFSDSMIAAGITHGFYYSLTDNFFLNVADHAAHASSSPLPGQVDVNQAEFERIALAQVTELWSNYGQLGEIVRAPRHSTWLRIPSPQRRRSCPPAPAPSSHRPSCQQTQN